MKFLANENIPWASIRLLREAGFEVESVLEKKPGSKDIDVLKQAHRKQLIILTFDRDYGELIYRYNQHVPDGVVFFRFDPTTPEEPAEILLPILRNRTISLKRKFTVIELDKIRQRSL